MMVGKQSNFGRGILGLNDRGREVFSVVGSSSGHTAALSILRAGNCAKEVAGALRYGEGLKEP